MFVATLEIMCYQRSYIHNSPKEQLTSHVGSIMTGTFGLICHVDGRMNRQLAWYLEVEWVSKSLFELIQFHQEDIIGYFECARQEEKRNSKRLRWRGRL